MRSSLLACAFLLSSISFVGAASAGETRTATGNFRFYQVVLETADGRWRQTVSDSFLFETPYVKTEGHHGSSVTSTARLGAKTRAVSAAINCLASFFLSGRGSDSWSKNCVATGISGATIIGVINTSTDFQQLSRIRFCDTAKSLAQQAGQTSQVIFSAKVRAFGDSEGTEGDRSTELGTVRGYCQ
jgi:hypothetical protein